jgi:hypothetical protein
MRRIDDPNAPPVTSLGRREFLAAAAGTAAVGLPAASHAASTASGLSVGYLDDAQGASTLRSAHGLLAGDAGLLHRGVRLSVLGLAGPRSPRLQGVTLLSHPTVPGLPQPLDVVHWGMRILPVESEASDSEQVVPLDADGTLKLSLEVRHGLNAGLAPIAKRTLLLELRTGWRPGTAKLQAGTYLLAFDFAHAPPNWSEQAVIQPDDGDAVALASSDFTYLIVKVGDAS